MLVITHVPGVVMAQSNIHIPTKWWKVGYDGSDVIYLTNRSSATNVPDISVGGYQTSENASWGLANALTLTIGNHTKYLSAYSYDAALPGVTVYLYIVATGFGKGYETQGGGITTYYSTAFQDLKVELNGFSSQSTEYIQYLYDNGFNMTNTSSEYGANNEFGLLGFGLSSLGLYSFLMGLEWPIAPLAFIIDGMSLIGPTSASSHPSTFQADGNGGIANQWTETTWKNFPENNTFSSSTRVELQIPITDFADSGNLTVTGLNQLEELGFGSTYQDGANPSFMIPIRPAFYTQGQVFLAPGIPYPNATVTLTQNANGNYANFMVKTNSSGYWSFYALPDASYTANCTLSDAFGHISSNKVTFTAGGPGGEETEQSLSMGAGVVEGKVQNGGSNANLINGATISITSSGKTARAETNWSGEYILGVPIIGTYSIGVNASGYNSQTGTVTVQAMNNVYYANFTKMVSFAAIPAGVESCFQIIITNSQDSPTASPYQQELVINSKFFYNYEADNLSNIEFFYANGNLIPSWLESGDSNVTVYGNHRDSTATIYWLQLNGIQALSSVVIYIGFGPPSINFFGSSGFGYTGEAPQLSAHYAQYDNGASVFLWYDNFAGNSTSIPSGWSQWSYAKTNNGLYIEPPQSGTTVNVGVTYDGLSFGPYATTDIFGTPLYPNDYSYSAAGYGYTGGNKLLIGNPSDYSYVSYPKNSPGGSGGKTNYPDKLGVWTISRDGSVGYSYFNYGDTHSTTGLPMNDQNLTNWGQASSNNSAIQWWRVRATPPNGVMPDVVGPTVITAWRELTIDNTQNIATSSPFQQKVGMNASAFSSFENAGLTNIEFIWGNGTVIPSWLENGSSSSNDAIFWIRVPMINSNSEISIYLVFSNPSINIMNGVTIGEAPQLSASYGQYDDGANVFLWYDNFAGVSLFAPSGWSQWVNATILNGLLINPSASGTAVNVGVTYSGMSFGAYTTTDIYGYPLYPNGNAYSAAGFGFTGSNLLVIGNPSGYTYVSYPKNAPGGNGGKTNYPDSAGIWTISRDGSDGYSYLNYGNPYSATGLPTNNQNITDWGQAFSNPSIIRWWRVRATPPNEAMPTVSNSGNSSSPPSPPPNGGGCVLFGTNITLANGTTTPVQLLRPGMKVLSYNPDNGSLVDSTVLYVNSSNVTLVVNVNGVVDISGLNDQPVYVELQNGTKEWVMLGQLNFTMKIYYPANSTWIPIYSLTILTGNFTVFDVVSSNFFYNGNYMRSDYIANGILLDKKAP